MKSSLAIIIGTGIQEKICCQIIPDFYDSKVIGTPVVLSLERFYRLGLSHEGMKNIRVLKDNFSKPWYDRNLPQKILSLIPYLYQLLLLSFKINYFLFFVDTGILERSAIYFLRLIRCKTVVLQDAMKRKPRFSSPKSLTWFGSGGADLYLLIGERYKSMVRHNRPTEIVGSPIYKNNITPLPFGENILIINQCFAKYGEVNPEIEYEFIFEVVREAVQFGPIELRLHPHNDFQRYQALDSFNIKITQKQSVIESLMNAGIVLCINSTVILEALILGRPVVTLDWHPSPFEMPVDDIFKRCKSIEEMKLTLEKWKENQKNIKINSEKLESTLRSFVAFQGSESTYQIVNALERFIASH